MNTGFYDLSKNKQYHRLLQANTPDEVKQIMKITSSDKDSVCVRLDKWLREAFKGKRDFCNAHLFIRKFKPLLNNETQQWITSKAVSLIAKMTSMSSHFDFSEVHLEQASFTTDELAHLMLLHYKSWINYDDIEFLNELLDDFPKALQDFEVVESMFLIAYALKTIPPLENFKSAYQGLQVEGKRDYLLLVRQMLSTSKSGWRDHNIKVLYSFYNLTPGQQKDILDHLVPSLRGLHDKARISALKIISKFPNERPAEVYETVSKMILHVNSNTQTRIVSALDLIPKEKRFLFASSSMDLYKSDNLMYCAMLLFQLSKQITPQRTGHFTSLFAQLEPYFEKSVNALDCFDTISNVLRDEQQLDDFIHLVLLFKELLKGVNVGLTTLTTHLSKHNPENMSLLLRIFSSNLQKIKSCPALFSIIESLKVFPDRDFERVLPDLCDLCNNASNRSVLTTLEAFPISQRAEIFLAAYPYLLNMKTSTQKQDFIMSVGMARVEGKIDETEPETLISPSISTTKPPIVTIERLNEEKTITHSLEQFIAQYLGDGNSPYAVAAAQCWIKNHALHVFLNPALFIREVTANAFDAQLPLEHQIGNFDVGFYSIFSLFYQDANPIDSIEIRTTYIGEDSNCSYSIHFRMDKEQRIQIEWRLLDKKVFGTGTSLYIRPKEGTLFSAEFQEDLKKTFDDFIYFEHGCVYVNGIAYGNQNALADVEATINDSIIKVKDIGKGIPLEMNHLLLVPSVSSKRRPTSFPITTPEAYLSVTNSRNHSSVVFTNNTVVNSIKRATMVMTNGHNEYYDIVVEFPKCFRPTISRDSIHIPSSSSPQAEAVCRMIDQVINDTLQFNMPSSNKIVMLYSAMEVWESEGLQNELKGYFTGYMQSALRKVLSENPHYLPCPCSSFNWYLNTQLFCGSRYRCIELHSTLVPEGYTKYELAVIQRYLDKIPESDPYKEIKREAASRKMIEGLSVLFIQDKRLSENGGIPLITCKGSGGILFAPLSVLDEGVHFDDVQRILCQRFADEGKKINAVGKTEASPLFNSMTFIPSLKGVQDYRGTPLISSSVYEQWKETPFIRSLDNQKCAYLFLKYQNHLTWYFKVSDEWQRLPGEDFFKRLCLLLLASWGIDPSDENNLKCYVDDKEQLLDLSILEKGVAEYVLGMESKESSIIYGGGGHLDKPLDLRQTLAPFAPLLANLNTFLTPTVSRKIRTNFIDICKFRQAAPAHCAPFADQLLELYQQYLRIPSHEFPHSYGSKNTLKIITQNSYFEIYEAINLMKQLPEHLAIKLLQEVIVHFKNMMDVNDRADTLALNCLYIPILTGLTPLALLTYLYARRPDSLPLISETIAIADTYQEADALTAILHFSRLQCPDFFALPLNYQVESLKQILSLLVRTEDCTGLSNWFENRSNGYNNLINDLDPRYSAPNVIKAGIDCIKLFTERYQEIQEPVPQFFRNPATLFKQNGTIVFLFSQLLGTIFSQREISSVLAKDDVTGLLQQISETPFNDQLQSLGMLSHSTSLKGGYDPWQTPLMEMLKNSVETIKENSSLRKGEFTVDVNYGIQPYDAETSQFVYEVSDPFGFDNFETLLMMLIPGFSPRRSNKLGLGFFRMLSEASLVQYKTRLRSQPERMISLIVQPIRNEQGDVTDLKIGMIQNEATDSFHGTIAQVFLKPQRNVETQIRLRQAHYFIKDTLEKIVLPEANNLKVFRLNGQQIYHNNKHIFFASSLNPDAQDLFGQLPQFKSKMKGVLLVDGIPQQVTLAKFLLDQGLPIIKHPFNLGGYMNFPRSYFEPLLDGSCLRLKKDTLNRVKKFVLDWLYMHICDDTLTSREAHEASLKLGIPHFNNSSQYIPQMIVNPQNTMDTVDEIVSRMTHTYDFNHFCAQYSLTGNIQIGGELQSVRLPSFAEYLENAFQTIYPIWEENKSNAIRPTLDPLNNWVKRKKQEFKDACPNLSFRDWNKNLLNIVKQWFVKKFIEYRSSATKKSKSETVGFDELVTKSSVTVSFPLLIDPLWMGINLFAEEVFTFYVNEVLKQHVSNPDVKVRLCFSNEFTGRYTHSTNTILINLNEIPLSLLLSLIAALNNKECDAHYIGDFIHSLDPSESGVLNHEIYHALKHLKHEEDVGHASTAGIHFEAGARGIADKARQNNILGKLELAITEALKRGQWTADSIAAWIAKAEILEKTLKL